MTKSHEHYREDGNNEEDKRMRQEEDRYYEEMLEEFEKIDEMEYDLEHDNEDELVNRTLKDNQGYPSDKPKKYDKPAKLNQ